MIKKLVLLFTSCLLTISPLSKTFALSAQKCKISTYNKIFHLDNPGTILANDLIADSDCPLKVKETFKNIIFKFKGPLRASYIQTAFKNEFKPHEVNISPGIINVIQLGTFLTPRLELKQNFKLIKLRFLDNRNILLLTDKESINVRCNNCNETGEKNLELKISDSITGFTKKTWLNGTVAVLTKVLISRSNQSVDSLALDAGLFKSSYIYTPAPEKYFSSIDKITYFKLNTPLHADRALKKSDLTSLNLVRPGIPAKIILKNNSLSLTSKALPMNYGKFGDTVHLKNLKNNRSIIGKVIDFNKVLIEL